jgi:hypothetical protein
MAVTTEYSIEYDAIENNSGLPLDNRDMHSKIRFMKFTFTQGAAAGDANSLAYLAKLPAGKINVIADLSKIYHSAFGAGRTLDVGYDAYDNPQGSEQSAVIDALLDGDDISAAGNVLLTGDAVDGIHAFHSKKGVHIVAKCLGDTIPAAATLNGHIAYTID